MSIRSAPLPDWVGDAVRLVPDLLPALARDGIRDEASYQARESHLPRRTRTALSQLRRDLLVLERVAVRDLARSAPPWVREGRIADLPVPHRNRDALTGAGYHLVSDLEPASDEHLAGLAGMGPFGLRALAFSLQRASCAPAPRAALSGPDPDRVSALLSGIPPELTKIRVTDLVPVPTRIRNAFRSERIETFGDLMSRTDGDLRMLPNFGQKSLEDLLTILEDLIGQLASETGTRVSSHAIIENAGGSAEDTLTEPALL